MVGEGEPRLSESLPRAEGQRPGSLLMDVSGMGQLRHLSLLGRLRSQKPTVLLGVWEAAGKSRVP